LRAAPCERAPSVPVALRTASHLQSRQAGDGDPGGPCRVAMRTPTTMLSLPDELLLHIFALMGSGSGTLSSLEELTTSTVEGSGRGTRIDRSLASSVPWVCRRFHAVCSQLLVVQTIGFDAVNRGTSARATAEGKLTGADVAAIVDPFRGVTGVDFTACTGLSIDVLAALAGSCRGLRRICLARCTHLTDVWLDTLAATCCTDSIGVNSVDLSGCPAITDTGVAALLSQNQRRGCTVRQLGLGGCTAVGGRWINSDGARHLRVLGLQRSRAVTDVWCEHLAEVCPDLQVLDLTGCTEVSGIGVAAVLLRCRNLAKIDLRMCKQVGDPAGLLVPPHTKLAALRHVVVAGCTKMGDGGVAMIASACGGGLRRLCLSGTSVSDAGLVPLAVHCGGVTELELCCLSRVTNDGLDTVAAGCQKLVRLSLAHCRRVSDAGVLQIVGACSELRWLDLRSCPGVSRACVERLRSERPLLHMPPRWEENRPSVRQRDADRVHAWHHRDHAAAVAVDNAVTSRRALGLAA